MVRSFDATFVSGPVLVVVALGIAVAAVARDDLRWSGTGSAGRILGEYQHPAAGDRMPTFREPRGLAIAWAVEALKTGAWMVWVHRPEPTKEC